MLNEMPQPQSFHTTSVGEARDYIARIFRCHDLQTVTPAALRFAVGHAQLGSEVHVAQFGYGAPVEIDVGWLEDFYALLVPLQGTCVISGVAGRMGDITLSPGAAAFVAPSAYLRSRADADYVKLVVRIDRDALEERFDWDDRNDTLLGRVSMVDLSTPQARPLCEQIALLRERANNGPSPGPPFSFDRFAWALQPMVNPNWGAGAACARSTADRIAGRAEAYMRRECGNDVTVESVASHLDVSSRTLFLAFRVARGYGPHAFLNRVRLEWARSELCRSGPADLTVTDLAERWRFGHLGRFSANYRDRFGEWPSQTRRRLRQTTNTVLP